MIRKYISMSKSNLFSIFIFISVTVFVSLLMGLIVGSFYDDSEYEYEVEYVGQDVEVEGDLIQYDSLNDTEQSLFNDAINSGDSFVSKDELNLLPDTETHTVQKENTIYIMNVNNKSNDPFVLLMLLAGMISYFLISIKWLFYE